MTRQEREILKHYLKRIKCILTEFEKYRISSEETIIMLRVTLRDFKKHMDEEYLGGE